MAPCVDDVEVIPSDACIVLAGFTLASCASRWAARVIYSVAVPGIALNGCPFYLFRNRKRLAASERLPIFPDSYFPSALGSSKFVTQITQITSRDGERK